MRFITGQELKRARIGLGLTQIQLAQKAGVGRNALSDIELGRNWSRAETHRKISSVIYQLSKEAGVEVGEKMTGSEFKDRIKTLGMTQSRFSEESGISLTTVNSFANGGEVRPLTYKKIYDALINFENDEPIPETEEPECDDSDQISITECAINEQPEEKASLIPNKDNRVRAIISSLVSIKCELEGITRSEYYSRLVFNDLHDVLESLGITETGGLCND